MTRRALLLSIGAAIALGALWLGRRGGSPDSEPRDSARIESAASSAILGERRPHFSLEDLDGEEVEIADFDGEVVVLNFWGTWCEPCVEEIPILVDLAREYAGRGVQVVGIAVDDPEPVRQFAEEAGIDYALLVGGHDGFDLVARYGNPGKALPYTVFIDREGTIRAAHNGKLSREQAEAKLAPLL